MRAQMLGEQLLNKNGFPSGEIIWVAVIILVFAAISCPIFAKVQCSDKGAACQNNLRKVFHALELYAGEHNGVLPLLESSNGKYWMDRLDPYTGTNRKARLKYDGSTPYQCPTALEMHPKFKKTNGNTYGVNGYCLSSQYFVPEACEWVDMDIIPTMKLPRLANPEKCMAFSDGHWEKNSWSLSVDVNMWAQPEFNHDGGTNVVFLDGHASCIKQSEMPGQCRTEFWWPFGMRK